MENALLHSLFIRLQKMRVSNIMLIKGLNRLFIIGMVQKKHCTMAVKVYHRIAGQSGIFVRH